jgi:hypothetical protein
LKGKYSVFSTFLMASIDDILNAEESDEDIPFSSSYEVDLENLLHSKDDDELELVCFEEKLQPPPPILPKVTLGAALATDLKSVCSDNPVVIHDILDSDRNSRGKCIPSVDILFNDEQDDDDVQDNIKTPFARAELNEQRFFHSDRKETVSALQAKRNSSVLIGYSNIRCDNLESISNQLKRNSSYKQHGPGHSTVMAVNAQFVAVGTSKGLVILFDHNHEIRLVLGSAMSASTVATKSLHPVSAISAIYATQGSLSTSKAWDGFVVCGHVTGEVVVWDVAKSSVVKLFSVGELHSNSITYVAITESAGEKLPVSSPASSDSSPFAVELPIGWAESDKNGSGHLSDYYASGLSVAAATLTSSSSSIVLVTVDSLGIMHKTKMSKTLWSSTLATESDCLLDTSTGPLSGCAALPSLYSSLQSNSAATTRRSTSSPVVVMSAESGAADCSVVLEAMRTHNVTYSAFLHERRNVRMMALNVGQEHTWIVQTHPFVRILHKWECPKNSVAAAIPVQNSSLCKSLDWTWSNRFGLPASDNLASNETTGMPKKTIDAEQLNNGGSADWVPVLARSWGDCVQLLAITSSVPFGSASSLFNRKTTSFQSESSKTAFSFMQPPTSSSKPSSAFGSGPLKSMYVPICTREFSGGVLAVRWISSFELVVLTSLEVIVVGVDLVNLEQVNLQRPLSLELRNILTPFVLPSLAENIGRSQLSCGVERRQLFMHVNDMVLKVQLQSCFDLADGLIAKGQWLEALALVVENTRNSVSLIGQHQEIDRYILRYIELAVKQPVISVSVSSSSTTPLAASKSAVSAAQSHHHLVSGVCIEYCVACNRFELLYGQVYGVFKAAQQHSQFLESLEPFILSGEIRSLPPSIIAEFCETALRTNRLPSIERCVSYFEVACIDVNFITKFLFENGMYSSFLYVYSNGLGDFPGAFQIIFDVLIRKRSSGALVSADPVHNFDLGLLSDEQTDISFKLLLFVSYTFDFKVFPRGGLIEGVSKSRGELTWEVLDLITRENLLEHNGSVFSVFNVEEKSKVGAVLGPYPYLMLLCRVDGSSLIQILLNGLKQVLDACSNNAPHVHTASVSGLMDRIYSFCERADAEIFRDSKLVGKFCDNLLPIVSVNVEVPVSVFLFTELIKFADSRPMYLRAKYEYLLKDLAKHQSVLRLDASTAHDCLLMQSVLRSFNFWIASLFVELPSELSGPGHVSVGGHDALSFYISIANKENNGGFEGHKKYDVSVQRKDNLVFSYIAAQLRLILTESLHHPTFLQELINVLVSLCSIDLEATQSLVRAHLAKEVPAIIDASSSDLYNQFQLLRALVDRWADLAPSSSAGLRNDNAAWFRPSLSSPAVELSTADTAAKIRESFSDKTIVVYFSLLASFDPAHALPFLQAYEHERVYPVDECLLVCRQKGLADCIAYLMERTGDVLDAMVLLLKDFSIKLRQVRRDIDSQLRVEMTAQAAAAKANKRISIADTDKYLVSNILAKQGIARSEASMRLPAYKMLERLINCIAGVCIRNGQQQHSTHQTSALWLTAFDHLLLERRK